MSKKIFTKKQEEDIVNMYLNEKIGSNKIKEALQ